MRVIERGVAEDVKFENYNQMAEEGKKQFENSGVIPMIPHVVSKL